jgi:hypothetical protein
MREMTEAERRWESWFAAWQTMLDSWPEPVEVACPEGDGGRVRLTYYALPGSRVGSVKVWCDKGLHGIFMGRVGIPAGAKVTPFGASPEEREAIPEITLFPDAWYTADDDDDDLVP